MKLRILGALALILSATGHAQADDRRTVAAFYFHSFTKSSCGFNMTAESAEKAAATLGMSNFHDPLFPAVAAVCTAVKKGNKSKVIEIRVRDNRNVMRKVTLERAKWWQ
ncbi:hypothetical protein [Rhizobium etli]|uniref:Dihydroxyacid dehydratase/phosphogluconate dehydratase n=1 Tax=Rhizobium etli TaxID=29449 RepID=A0A7W6VDW7_RHIET|nr:hypothetical protein [Rhizobium etli]MBB4482493.1 dihydroxyacid dehydratase/phosphogluconate dehydratase [Rhizobium etli]MBB4538322.1 dihydroxyacid dehydratase/phosphogluconate dehydratase [Rhizobium etli]